MLHQDLRDDWMSLYCTYLLIKMPPAESIPAVVYLLLCFMFLLFFFFP